MAIIDNKLAIHLMNDINIVFLIQVPLNMIPVPSKILLSTTVSTWCDALCYIMINYRVNLAGSLDRWLERDEMSSVCAV